MGHNEGNYCHLIKVCIMEISPSRLPKDQKETVCDNAGQIKRWWFVPHDSEEVLQSLENKWDQIQCQTGWKLELCFRPLTAIPEENPSASLTINMLSESPSCPEKFAIGSADDCESHSLSLATHTDIPDLNNHHGTAPDTHNSDETQSTAAIPTTSPILEN